MIEATLEMWASQLFLFKLLRLIAWQFDITLLEQSGRLPLLC